MTIKQNLTGRWFGKHKGIAFEINLNHHEQIGRWYTYYLMLHIDRIPKEHDTESYWMQREPDCTRLSYKYNEHPVLSECDFHHGMTWYSKESGFDGEPRIIKVGCDYNHVWDHDRSYSLENIIADATHTIDVFLSLVPTYKMWCCGNGKLYDASEGLFKNDEFYSEEYYGEKEWYQELKKQVTA